MKLRSPPSANSHPHQRQQLLQILIQDDFAENSPTQLELLNVQFWQGISLGQLRTTQTPSTVDNLKDLAADFWPEEDSIEEFLNFLQQQRQDVIPFFEILARHTHRRGRPQGFAPTDIYGTLFEKWYKKVSITLDDEVLDFVDRLARNRSRFINDILLQEKEKTFMKELESAYIDQANDPEFQEEVSPLGHYRGRWTKMH